MPVSYYLGRKIEELAIPDDSPQNWTRHLESFQAHLPINDFSFWRTKPEGERRYLAVSAKPIHDPSGEFLGYRGTTRDITDQRLAEEALRSSEEKFRNLIDGSHQGVVIANLDREILFCNQSAAQIYGYASPHEIIALSSSFDLVAPHERGRIGKSRKAHFGGATAPQIIEYEGLRKNGEHVHIQAVQRVLSRR